MNFEEEEIIEDDMILHDKIKPLRFSVVYDEVEVKQLRAVITLQAHVRGHQIRRKQKEGKEEKSKKKKLMAPKEKVSLGNERSEEDSNKSIKKKLMAPKKRKEKQK